MEVRTRQARANSLRPLRQSHVPQGSAADIRLSSKDLEAIQKRALGRLKES
jgi:predicted DNA binding CopG/RHH family protein